MATLLVGSLNRTDDPCSDPTGDAEEVFVDATTVGAATSIVISAVDKLNKSSSPNTDVDGAALLLPMLSENDDTGALATGENERSSPTDTSPESDADLTDDPETAVMDDGIVAARGGGSANDDEIFEVLAAAAGGGSNTKPDKLETAGALDDSDSGENESNSASVELGALDVLNENTSAAAVLGALLATPEKISGMDEVDGIVRGATTGENDSSGDPISISIERGSCCCCCGASNTPPLLLKLFVLDAPADRGGSFTISANGLSYSSSNETSDNPDCENAFVGTTDNGGGAIGAVNEIDDEEEAADELNTSG